MEILAIIASIGVIGSEIMSLIPEKYFKPNSWLESLKAVFNKAKKI